MPPTERNIALKKGEQTEVRFKGGTAGGYDWSVKVDNETLVMVTKTFETANSDTDMLPGKSAEEVFAIKALEKGKAVLHFTQQRHWEIGEPPRKEEKIIIEIS